MEKGRFLFSALLVLMLGFHQKATAQYSIPAKMNWWYEARFGMFIHFGSYSQLGHGEWAFATENWTKSNYQTQVTAKFNPTGFNAGTIARLAAKAGMKYLVITAKHHEGFCMWDTQVESFKDVTGTKAYDLPGFTNFRTRDILQELKDSCDAVGVKFCLYYSILDWNHPSQTIYNQNYSTMASMTARTNYITDMKAQLKELITKYHPAIMWFDGDWTFNSGSPTLTSWWTKTDGVDLYQFLTRLDPKLIVNERVCRGFGIGDYLCPEQKIPAYPESKPWETCQTMNNSWGYNMYDNNYKSVKTMLLQLIQVVSRDGNFLLNIGPKGDGTVTSGSVTILNGFASWMGKYSESVYGTTRSPFVSEPTWGYYTKKTGKLYAHVFSWPSNHILEIPSLTNTINKVYLLNDTTTLLSFTESKNLIKITLPDIAPNSINSVVTIDVSGVPKAAVLVTGITVKGAPGAITTSGGMLQLTASIVPSGASNKTVTWSVSDSTIASVSNTGLLKAKANGLVGVIATANDKSEIQGKLSVTVSGQTPVTSAIDLNVSNSGCKIYPNPCNGLFTIELSVSEIDKTKIQITDLHGREVSSLSNCSRINYINISNYPKGTYIAKIKNFKGEITQKLIVE